MKEKYRWIVGLIAIIGILITSGCVKQQITPVPEEKISNQCITELNVFEDKFGINAKNISLFGSECSTCSPWYTPEVSTFSAILENGDKTYTLFYSNTCPRHAESIVNYRIISSEQDELYNKTKEKICSDYSIYTTYLNECSGSMDTMPTINEFVSCVNNYSRYIELDILDIDKDWLYCSTEGWNDCEKWNSCEPTDSTQASRCTQEYCQMSCLIVYSEERIQKRFVEECKNWDILLYGSGGPNYLFSFESPKDIRKIITNTFLKQ